MLHFGVGRSNIEVQKSLFVALRDGCRCADSESAFGALRKQIEERSWLTATRMTHMRLGVIDGVAYVSAGELHATVPRRRPSALCRVRATTGGFIGGCI
jgi:hypothetical protein